MGADDRSSYRPRHPESRRRGDDPVALLCADLRDFTALSEATESPPTMPGPTASRGGARLRRRGGEVYRRPRGGDLPGRRRAGRGLRGGAARAGMAHLDAVRQALSV
jgi:adenylate cyclase